MIFGFLGQFSKISNYPLVISPFSFPRRASDRNLCWFKKKKMILANYHDYHWTIDQDKFWSMPWKLPAIFISRHLLVLTHWPLENWNEILGTRYLIFQIISVTDGWGISCELVLRWMSLDLTDDKSTLVQVIVWCRQATSHYLSQYWPRSLSPYGITRPQWVY